MAGINGDLNHPKPWFGIKITDGNYLKAVEAGVLLKIESEKEDPLVAKLLLEISLKHSQQLLDKIRLMLK